MQNPPTLIEYIFEQQKAYPHSSGDLSQILSSISLAAKVVHSKINCAGLLDLFGDSGITNVQGETQQKLDLYANDVFKSALRVRGHVCGMLSEEEDDVTDFQHLENDSSKYIVAIDPIDGSSNIDVNVPVGTVFSIYKRLSKAGDPVEMSDFLQPGRVQIAAGYIIYGPSTMLVYTTGNGVNGFTFDPSIGEFFLSHENLKFPAKGKIFSISEGHSDFFSDGLKAYIQHCKTPDKQAGRPYTARYVGSMVSDFHRNLLKGGIYIYPGYKKNEQGKLRLIYECNPLAFIAQQAGGTATNGKMDILNVDPSEAHQRSPLYIGPSDMVEEVMGFIKDE